MCVDGVREDGCVLFFDYCRNNEEYVFGLFLRWKEGDVVGFDIVFYKGVVVLGV